MEDLESFIQSGKSRKTAPAVLRAIMFCASDLDDDEDQALRAAVACWERGPRDQYEAEKILCFAVLYDPKSHLRWGEFGTSWIENARLDADWKGSVMGSDADKARALKAARAALIAGEGWARADQALAAAVSSKWLPPKWWPWRVSSNRVRLIIG